MAPDVTVFIDYQNAHMSAHTKWCGFSEPLHECLIDPVKLGEKLVEKRAPGGNLTAVHVYRGRPDPRREAAMAGYNDRHKNEWRKDPRVEIHTRALRYPQDFGQPGCYERPREKGIDVWLAVDLVRMAIKQEYEVGIVFSRDDDLTPALEVGTWEGASRLRLPFRELYCHMLDEDDFRAVIDTRAY